MLLLFSLFKSFESDDDDWYKQCWLIIRAETCFAKRETREETRERDDVNDAINDQNLRNVSGKETATHRGKILHSFL